MACPGHHVAAARATLPWNSWEEACIPLPTSLPWGDLIELPWKEVSLQSFGIYPKNLRSLEEHLKMLRIIYNIQNGRGKILNNFYSPNVQI